MSPAERERQERRDAAFGEWVRERLAAQKPERWTQQRLRDELAQRGHEVKREWVNQVINGKHASDELRKAVERLLGEFPEPASDQTTGELASALTAQATALTALVDELRMWRQEDRERLRQIESMVDGLVAESLGALGRPAATGPLVPERTAG